MFRLFSEILIILSAYQLSSFATQVDSTLASYYCDEHLLQDIERHLKVVNFAQENQRLSIELLTKKVDELQSLLKNQANTSPNDEINANKFKSCDEALKNSTAKDGIYQLNLPSGFGIRPFFAYCLRDAVSGKPWTIIQRRINGNIDFYRDWLEYEIGFGDLMCDHWLGLNKIHALTNSRPHKLWIELRDFENETRNAYFDIFGIGNADAKYALNVLGAYTGDAGDSLRYHTGHKFSTKDNGNDATSDNSCAIERKGAWWFNSCQECNLNGEYFDKPLLKKVANYGMGINWYSWHGEYYSLKYAHMAIRPID